VEDMRRLFACAIAFLLVLHTAAVAARGAGGCCVEGCVDLAACVQMGCQGCPAQAIEPAATPRVPAPSPGPAWPSGTSRRWQEPGAEIWRPPREPAASGKPDQPFPFRRSP
jgi:hypothetical protein